MADPTVDLVERMAPQAAHWVKRYEALTRAEREEYGPFAAKRWPTAYERRNQPGWDAMWKTLLVWIVTDPSVFSRVEAELANAERKRIAESPGRVP